MSISKKELTGLVGKLGLEQGWSFADGYHKDSELRLKCPPDMDTENAQRTLEGKLKNVMGDVIPEQEIPQWAILGTKIASSRYQSVQLKYNDTETLYITIIDGSVKEFVPNKMLPKCMGNKCTYQAIVKEFEHTVAEAKKAGDSSVANDMVASILKNLLASAANAKVVGDKKSIREYLADPFNPSNKPISGFEVSFEPTPELNKAITELMTEQPSIYKKIRGSVAVDFAEVFGAISLAAALSENVNDATIFFPKGSNEPILDYCIAFKGDTSKDGFKISAKTNVGGKATSTALVNKIVGDPTSDTDTGAIESENLMDTMEQVATATDSESEIEAVRKQYPTSDLFTIFLKEIFERDVEGSTTHGSFTYLAKAAYDLLVGDADVYLPSSWKDFVGSFSTNPQTASQWQKVLKIRSALKDSENVKALTTYVQQDHLSGETLKSVNKGSTVKDKNNIKHLQGVELGPTIVEYKKSTGLDLEASIKGALDILGLAKGSKKPPVAKLKKDYGDKAQFVRNAIISYLSKALVEVIDFEYGKEGSTLDGFNREFLAAFGTFGQYYLIEEGERLQPNVPFHFKMKIAAASENEDMSRNRYIFVNDCAMEDIDGRLVMKKLATAMKTI